MSNADFPATVTAEQSDSGAQASANSDGLGQLPERVRVHALAKLLGSSSREVLGKLGELGETARSPQSSVPRSTALRVAEMFAAPEQVPEQAQDSASTQTPAAEAPAAETSTVDAAGTTSAPGSPHVPVFAAPSPVFLPPEPTPGSTQRDKPDTEQPVSAAKEQDTPGSDSGSATQDTNGNQNAGEGDQPGTDDDDGARKRRRRGRRGRGRGKGTDDGSADASDSGDQNGDDGGADQAEPASQQDKQQVAKQDGKAKQQGKQDNGGTGKQSGSKQQAQQGAAKSGEKSGEKSGDKAGDKSAGKNGSDTKADAPAGSTDDSGDSDSAGENGDSKHRRRRRRRKGGSDDSSNGENPPNTVTHVRENSTGDRGTDSDGVRSVRGSTRLEAKRQRRRDGREAGRRRAPILSEAEFLARRESVERSMVVADKDGSTQIGVLEDDVLVEHFVTAAGSGSIVGNVYLGRVQNVLPSMEAAFIDIGRGRNAVLYAGEVDWDSAGLEGKARKIEQALSSGDQVLVQVSKDPLGHKGARLTTQISLPGRFLVYVPSGGTTGISRKLPESERRRLKDILKRVVPEDAGVIIRTASEGISEQELERDVQRLREEWETIKQRSDAEASSSGNSSKSKKSGGAPALLYEEPDLLIKVVRDLFTEDFRKMEIQGENAWQTIYGYVQKVAPELTDRVKRYVGTGDVFADHRIDEQITKALDRKVWLPSGGYLVIDRTEAMTVIDVNTGKFTGSGGNLEETVTRNNLESAEEIVRQLRLRDIGGIIVIDFIDMVLESNRELVLRRLTECLGRDRTRHQVAEVTSLGLVQMTRKRLGTGLLESFSTTCEHCKGRGLHISTEPNRGSGGGNGGGNGGQSGSRKRGKGEQGSADSASSVSNGPTQHQRESAANAVAVMANAAKTTPTKPGEQDSKGDKGGSAEPEKATEQAAASVETAPADDEQAGSTGVGQDQSTQEAQSAQQDAARSTSRPVGRRTRRAVSRPAGPPA